MKAGVARGTSSTDYDTILVSGVGPEVRYGATGRAVRRRYLG